MSYGGLCLRRVIVFQISQDVISRKFERAYEGSSHDFLEIELDRNESHKSFDAFRRGSFEGTKYLDGGSSLHFIENFEVVQQRSFVIKPQLKAVHDYRERAASI